MTGTAVPKFRVRTAVTADAEGIARLLKPYAEQGLVLPRTAAEIGHHIGRFEVATTVRNTLAGCVALREYGDGLVEIRSLAVSRRHAGHGLGSTLVTAAAERARREGAVRVFALTLRPNLFQRLGFVVVEDKEKHFPQKVWNDCRHCRKRDQCDETAVLLEL